MSKCIFCLNESTSFDRIEHIVPESLGNDDLVLPLGFVCNSCNQYFGTKIEQKVLSHRPFGVERVMAGVKSKKGKYPNYRREDGSLMMQSTGYTDTILLIGDQNRIQMGTPIYIPCDLDQPSNILRLMLKMGLELLCLSENHSPYGDKLDMCRKHARYGIPGLIWDLGYAIIPRHKLLEIENNYEPITQNQTLYRYEMGQLINGDIIFSFIYRCHVFIVCLTGVSLESYQTYSSICLHELFDLKIVKTKL
jgi:hypothetical protein